ncbi:MAG: hypothetical protein NUW12_11240 [Firmicutes bacterium]|nr:hypothetical protein [Bacillota bacterium]MDH7496529.1 hypothetical protein [Bacillota bacterium]
MIQLNAEDVIRGLKRLKSLAKQDILISSLAPNPEAWIKMATARKQKYETLIAMVEQYGVPGACEIALEEYASLPATDGGDSADIDPHTKGEEQALEVFFKTIGVDGRALKDARTRRKGAGGVQ